MGVKDVARLLGRTPGTVRTYVKAEDLPHRRENGRLVFDEAEVKEWLARPETQAMLGYGEIIKNGRNGRMKATSAA